jgi:beta-lactamase regulating signal transducer with metallopeptidase domain
MIGMSAPLSEAIGLAVLHLLWQGVLIAAILALALKLLSRSNANIRYLLSCTALAAMVLLGVMTARSSYEAEGDAAPIVFASRTEAQVDETEAVPAGEIARAPLVFVEMHSSTIALVWLLGVTLLSTRLAVSWNRVRRLMASTEPVSAELEKIAGRLALLLGVDRLVRLAQSASVDVPSVAGFLKPVILVPASSLSGLSTRQLEMIFAHELAHIRRHDYVVNMLQSVAETLLFYHPAAWWISRQIRVERENCCDDLAVATCGNALEYARALAVLEELREGPSLAVAANGGSLLDRVRRLIGAREKNMVNGWTAVAAAVSFAVVMTVTSLPLQADRDTPPAPTPAAEVDVVAPRPAVAPRVVPTPRAVPTPRPAMAVAPVAVIAGDDDFDYDFDVDVDLPEIPAPPAIPMDLDLVVPVTPPPAPPAPPAMAAFAALDFGFGDDPKDSDKPMTESGPLTVDELIALRIHGVTPAFIAEMRNVFGSLSLKQVRQLKTMGVTAKYVADIRAAGVNITTPKEAVQLKMYGVTPEFVRSLAAAGYSKLTPRDLARLAMAGVNADFIREMSKYRDKK